jgi:phage tail sheath protein FI
MPAALSYPGVYIEEIPSGVRTIAGVATAITAFIGRAPRGPVDVATRIQSFADYERQFGGLNALSTMSYAVQQYFQQGGSDAYVIRVHNAAGTAAISLPTSGPALVLAAANPGKWGSSLRASVNYDSTKDPTSLFTLTIQELAAPASTTVLRTETFLNLSSNPSNARWVTTVLAQESALVRVDGSAPTQRPTATITNADDPTDASKYVAANSNGTDGADITDSQIAADSLKTTRHGIYALDEADLFNILCIPPLSFEADVSVSATFAKAAAYCKARRALLLVDPPASWVGTTSAEAGIATVRTAIGNDLSTNVAVYFPRLRAPDPLQENRLDSFVPCGAVAGIMARTDAARGVWKAPAGLDASLSGVPELSFKLDDPANGRLNPLGLNCIRAFPAFGNVVWGARTLAGSDILGSEWKYLPVRRLALFLEESLYRGTQWVVFEPNDEPLWAQIRLNVGAFMHNLFRLGAFQGRSPQEAYFVKCDKVTTTQNDINLGIVNVVVGFAPLKPAEFVVLKIQQIAGEIAT